MLEGDLEGDSAFPEKFQEGTGILQTEVEKQVFSAVSTVSCVV